MYTHVSVSRRGCGCGAAGNGAWRWGYPVDDFPVVDLGADGHEVAKELVDGIARPEVRELEQIGMGLDDGADQPLDLFGSSIG